MINLFFDTETTGLPFRPAPEKRYGQTHNTNGYPRLVQIGWILTDDDRTLTKQEYIIKPEGFSIPDEASAIHGITTKEAIEKGVPLFEVLYLFAEILHRVDNIIGHNIAFDMNVMVGEFRREGMMNAIARLTSKPVTDTMKSTVEFCALPFPSGRYKYNSGGCFKYPKLGELYLKLFGCELENAHNAMTDIDATRRCYIELHQRGLL